MIFIPAAYAQTAQQGTAEFLNTLLMFGLIFLVFYFLVIRPQQKKLKQHRELLGAIRRGDRVVTGGGMIGLVTKVVSAHEVVVEIAENVRVRMVRETIANVINKTESVGKVEDGEGETDASAPRSNGKGHFPGLRKLLGDRDQ
ncbi:Preprotein translocase subunit YajC (TC 3.A.5.1.1) [invertebrate metagenome]|uniref:Preprotein translocase subunit YajC (TC 3.A.5.1.1) n=1 Tax=invertebrate metagenome TaxID=1711999 RepID=A0A484HBE2_9ZZZZ